MIPKQNDVIHLKANENGRGYIGEKNGSYQYFTAIDSMNTDLRVYNGSDEIFVIKKFQSVRISNPDQDLATFIFDEIGDNIQ